MTTTDLLGGIDRTWRSSVVFVAVPVALAAGVTWFPLPTAAVAALCASAAVSTLVARGFTKTLSVLLAILLAGYAFGGKSFAYLGIAPVYVGEIVLALALIGCIAGGTLLAPFRSRTAWLVVAFGIWCLAQTVGYVPTYGLDALRDATLFGYAAFGLVVAGLILRARTFAGIVAGYRRLLPFFLVWAVSTWVIRLFVFGASYASSGDSPWLSIKGGDGGVHLAGIASFMILGLHRVGVKRFRHSGLAEWGLWSIWSAGFLLAGAQTRGGLVSMLAALSAVLFLRPSGRWGKLAVVAIVGLAVFAALDLQLDVGRERKATPQQILVSLASLGGGADPSYDGTRRWRLMWWESIVNYTIHGDHFWRGKGFGINLADDDGFQVDPQHRLRSPHNGHLTVLARTGVPGLLLWFLMQVSLAAGLLRSYYRARRERDAERAALTGWVFCYWVAFVVNAAFDVYLEGPQGGIWYWSVFGMGLALLAKRPSQRSGTAWQSRSRLSIGMRSPQTGRSEAAVAGA